MNFRAKFTKTLRAKISATTHGILKFFEDSETSAKTPETFFDLVDFDHGNLLVRAHENFAFLVRARKKIETLGAKISGTTHGIFKILADSESSAKTPERYFDLIDFDHGNLPNELHEVFIFSVRVGVRLDSHQ